LTLYTNILLFYQQGGLQDLQLHGIREEQNTAEPVINLYDNQQANEQDYSNEGVSIAMYYPNFY